MREFLHYLREAFWVMVHPRTHVLSDEDQQTADEHARVITAWVASHRHPPECAGGCQCPSGGAA
jgi:hypothetical protein